MAFPSFNISASKTHSPKSRNRRNLCVETLESRNLMAAIVELDVEGTLVIEGTSGDDKVSVQAFDDNIMVTSNGSEHLFDDTGSISQILFRGHDGDDEFYNQTNIQSLAEGGEGNDTLQGGSGVDSLYGNSGNDTLYGGNGNDKLYGGRGADILRGEQDNDELHGGRHKDVLRGGSGADILHGNQGADELRGGTGKDRLYGDGGNDQLFGNRGDDGLFGGEGDDELSGGRDDDRFLVQRRDSDVVTDRADEDAVITFVDDSATWTEAEIELLDRAFDTVHHTTQNTNLLQKQEGDDIRFLRRNVSANGRLNGINRSAQNFIALYDKAFNNDDKALKTTFHEIGHNWGGFGRNTDWQTFLDKSGWTPLSSDDVVPEGKVRSKNGKWYYDDEASFARKYGQKSPGEDFATVFSASFMTKAGLPYDSDDTEDQAEDRLRRIADKIAYIDDIVVREQTESD